jgi:hypothetical protein
MEAEVIIGERQVSQAKRPATNTVGCQRIDRVEQHRVHVVRGVVLTFEAAVRTSDDLGGKVIKAALKNCAVDGDQI